MEKDLILKVIDAFKEMNSIMQKLLGELEKDVNSMEAVDAAPKGRKKKDAPAVPGSEAAAPPAEEKKGLITAGDITIEMLREMATKYSSAFGMPKLLELNLKHGGVKKLKDLDKGIYGVLYGAMSDELAKAATPAPEGAGAVTNGKPPEGITKDKLREAAAQFIAANGEPALHAVLKAFGAHKISEVAAEKYPAFLEAISNA